MTPRQTIPHVDAHQIALQGEQATTEIRVGAELTVRDLPRDAETAIIAANTFTNPEYARKRRLRLWTGATDERIGLYRRTPAGLVVPRGTFETLTAVCHEHGLWYAVVDETIAPPLGMTLTPGTLYDYQDRALTELLRSPTGLLEATTGSGKTNILLSAIPRLGTHTLILVHTRTLFEQMRERCRQWLGVEPGALGAGEWDVQPITVGMIQTVARRGVDEIANNFGCVLIDECHHAPAKTWAAILNQLPARYKYGCSATAWRKDGLQCVMWRTIGPVTAKVLSSEVTRAGRIVVPDIKYVHTGFAFDLQDATDWTRMLSALVRDEDRNVLIADEVRARLERETRGLVLTDRIEHVDALADLLNDLKPVVLTGDMTRAARDAAMAAVRAGAQLMIATNALVGEGVDVPGWDLLFLATPMAGGPRTLQAIGRVARAAPGKDRATVVDFVDANVPALAGAHRQRERLYRGVGAVA